MAAAFLLEIQVNQEERILQRPRVFRDRTRTLETVGDAELISRYRLPRHLIFKLVGDLSPRLARGTQRSKAISPELQVLITLRYLGKSGFQTEIGDIHGLSQPSVSRCINATINALCSLDLVKFPTDAASITEVKARFYKLAGFPSVLGCVDGTLVPILRPPGDEEAAYVCRKGYHAVNVQAICDADLRFTNVVCKWPGATHDSFMLSASRISSTVEGLKAGWLLGDSGYGCKPWLLTPLSNPVSRPEQNFNTSLTKTRNSIERSFGVLKSRFRCLSKTGGALAFRPGKCHKVVFAACQLHNMCINERVAHPPPTEADDDANDDNNYQGAVSNDGLRTRQTLIRNFFT